MREVTDIEQERLDRLTPFQEPWAKFLERLGAFTDSLASDLRTCREDLASILDSQASRGLAPPEAEAEDLAGFRAARARATLALLHDPVSQERRKKICLRALQALENYEQSLADLASGLPSPVPATGPQLLSCLGNAVARGWRANRVNNQATSRNIPLREIVAAELLSASHPRLEPEGRYLLVLLQAARSLRQPWDSAREALDTAAAGGAAPRAGRDRALPNPPKDRAAWLAEKCDEAVERLQAHPRISASRIADRVLSSFLRPNARVLPGSHEATVSIRAHWAAQLHVVEEELRLELLLVQFEDRLLMLAENSLRNLEAEHSHLVAELDRAMDWLGQQLNAPTQGAFPEPRCDLVPASMRLAEIDAGVQRELEALPESTEVTVRLSPLPPPASEPRMLAVRETCRQVYLHTTRPRILEAQRLVESEHRRILQGIERARQVVAFGAEPASPEAAPDPALAREAMQNALSLLQYYREERIKWREPADRILFRSLASQFLESRLVLRRRRLGVLLYLAEQGFRSAAAEVARRSAAGLAGAWNTTVRVADRAGSAFLIRIGWKEPPREDRMEVVTRPVMPGEFVEDLTRKELPMLYRRLFRYEPIEDPRFLVGRERELGAIAEARRFWESGRPAAVMIVGQRGSGKTSIINCALKRDLAGLEVIRGEFGRRISNEALLRDFLARLLGLEVPEQIESSLLERRRVVILEELERTFLRQVGYYGAVRALLRLIAATCPSTLWVLATNEVSFQFLEPAVQLGRSFSHRINAGSAPREDLYEAIMMRHKLSGLRLNFLAQPAETGPLRTALGRDGKQKDPGESFFDVLASESGGVYRSAFDLWLGQIDAIQAGEIVMRPLLRPELSPVVDDLSLEDLFTLVAILQHGGLTAEEHMVVFQESVASSRARLDGLIARELIEPDPARDGLRVRPQAMRIVREALYRRNLL